MMAGNRILGEDSEKINVFIKEHLPRSRTWDDFLHLMKRTLGVQMSHNAANQRARSMNVSLGSAAPSLLKDSDEAISSEEEEERTTEQIEFDKRVGKLSLEQGSLKKKYKIVLARNEELEQKLTAALALRSNKKSFVIKQRAAQKDSEATAFVIASDWHVEEEVRSESVNGVNKYNLDIAKIRSTEFFERSLRLIKKEQQDVIIHEMVLGLLGDFITGYLREEDRERNLLQPMDAALYAQELLISGIDFYLNHSKLRITCVCKVGNHGRTTHKVHMSTETGNSLEWMLYHALARHFRGNDRVRFVVEEGYHTLLDVYDRVIRFHHGHAINYHGGVGGLSIPANKKIANWNDKRATSVDMDVFGHLHTYMPLPKFTCNGSLIGYNAFAIHKGFSAEQPQQALFLLDKKRGKTVTMPILFSC